jgi:hypothetical protein
VEPVTSPAEPRDYDVEEDDADGDRGVVERLRIDCVSSRVWEEGAVSEWRNAETKEELGEEAKEELRLTRADRRQAEDDRDKDNVACCNDGAWPAREEA